MIPMMLQIIFYTSTVCGTYYGMLYGVWYLLLLNVELLSVTGATIDMNYLSNNFFSCEDYTLL